MARAISYKSWTFHLGQRSLALLMITSHYDAISWLHWWLQAMATLCLHSLQETLQLLPARGSLLPYLLCLDWPGGLLVNLQWKYQCAVLKRHSLSDPYYHHVNSSRQVCWMMRAFTKKTPPVPFKVTSDQPIVSLEMQSSLPGHCWQEIGGEPYQQHKSCPSNPRAINCTLKETESCNRKETHLLFWPK